MITRWLITDQLHKVEEIIDSTFIPSTQYMVNNNLRIDISSTFSGVYASFFVSAVNAVIREELCMLNMSNLQFRGFERKLARFKHPEQTVRNNNNFFPF